jgi:hypothetical protein
MSIDVQCGGCGGVAHPSLHSLNVGAGRDQQTGQIMRKSWKQNFSGRPGTLVRAARTASSTVFGEQGLSPSLMDRGTIHSEGWRCTDLASSSAWGVDTH